MRYDVVLVPFPFDDLSGSKVRPAVCLTDTVGVHRHVVLAFVTSVMPAAPEQSDVLLDSADPEFPGHRFEGTFGVAPASYGDGVRGNHPASIRHLRASLAIKTEQRLRLLFKL